jgi:hypothetical protein
MARPEVTGKAPRRTAGTSHRSTIPDPTEMELTGDGDADIEPVDPDDAGVMAQRSAHQARGPPKLAMSVAEFCLLHSISIGFFYELLKRGEGPRIMKVGLRTLVSVEEAARWRAMRTAATTD